MDRDKQIELLKGAKERVQGNVAAWTKDSRVQETLRRYHERMKEQANPPAPKQACG